MERFKELTIGFLGGDQRETMLMRYLKKLGANICIFGDSPSEILAQEIHSLPDFMAKVDVLIGPMPGIDNDAKLKKAYAKEGVFIDRAFFTMLGTKKPFLIGVVPEAIYKQGLQMGAKIISTTDLDEIAVLNAIPTAEGAIQIALGESQRTLFGSTVVIFGLGRIGRVLGKRLALLGSKVYGVARRAASYAWGEELGIMPLREEDFASVLNKTHFVFNTVPSLVVDREILSLCKKEAIIIDLSTAPGGIDFIAAEEMNLKALLCLGLPGKMFPESAGEIICQEYPNLIIEALSEIEK